MSTETFEYQGIELPYFDHLYNITYLNERRVEVPIANHFLRYKSPGCGLEVGNVLGHYSRCEHDVCDLNEPRSWYQEQQAYMNVDLFELRGHSYIRDWVVSLSTVEHTANPAEAIGVLQGLAPNGLVTFPTGVDPVLDSWIEDGMPVQSGERACTLARTGDGLWAQTSLPQTRPYGPWANAVAVLEWDYS
jgi:hypothetical protein